MQKILFECKNCEAKGKIILPDECDEQRVEACPCCGDPLDLSDEDDD